MRPLADRSRVADRPMGSAAFLKGGVNHADLLYAVVSRIRDGRAALEVGVGSGARSAMLSRLRERVLTVDDDREVLSVARANLARFGRDVRVVCGDSFALPFATGSMAVAFSRGLFEHFDDESLRALLREQLRVADSVVFSVPSAGCAESELVGGRLMEADGWAEIVERAIAGTSYRVRARGYRLDPAAWRRSLMYRRWEGPCSILVTVDPGR